MSALENSLVVRFGNQCARCAWHQLHDVRERQFQFAAVCNVPARLVGIKLCARWVLCLWCDLSCAGCVLPSYFVVVVVVLASVDALDSQFTCF